MNFDLSKIKSDKNVEIKFTQLFINNEFVDAVNGKKYTIIDPSTEEKLVDIQSADHADVEKAVNAAKAAFHRKSAYRTMDPYQRGQLLNKLADLVEQNVPYIASLEAKNVGKPFVNAVLETFMAVQMLRYFAGWADKIQGKTIPTNGPHFAYTRLEPVGIVGHIVPWNVPFYNACQKIGPVIATGCTMVMKPSEITPLTSLFICKLAKEAGIPAGVINVLPGLGSEAGEAIGKHPEIRKVAFTGSTKIGKHLAGNCSATLKHLTLELGGKSPLVVCPDFDLDEAAGMAIFACFLNNGQACLNGTRTYVHESIYDEFVKKVVAIANARVVGDIFDPKTVQGPQINRMQFDKILGLIEKGKEEGAKLECGGKRFGTKGYFIEPTVFSNVTDDMTIAREEIFGPVMSVLKWSDFEDVIERSNNSSYGLAAGILTKDLDKANTFAMAVESGSVWINVYPYMSPMTPFGGYKQSGFGREMGEDCLKNFMEVKTVVTKLPYKSS